MDQEAQFTVGQLVRHKLFGYRGVIIDVDPEFLLTDEWYDAVAKSRPPKEKPWYHVLVHETPNQTYVAERNLEPDQSVAPIEHPQIEFHFREFSEGHYLPRHPGH